MNPALCQCHIYEYVLKEQYSFRFKRKDTDFKSQSRRKTNIVQGSNKASPVLKLLEELNEM